MKKFDSKVWIFIAAAVFVIPGYYHIRALIVGDIQPIYVYIVGAFFSFVVTLTITYVNMVILGRYFDRVLPWQNRPRQINIRLALEFSVTSMPAALIISLITFSLDNIFPQMDQGMSKAQMYFDNISIALVVNLIALSIIEGNSIYIMWKESLIQAESLKREKIETQFAVLKNQVNPHFLFNSLNAVLGVMRDDPRRAEMALEELGELFRALMRDNRELVPLSEEIALARKYLDIEKLRLGDRLQVRWEVADCPPDMLALPLLLQPLLENAVYHGIEPALEAGEIRVHISAGRDGVRIEIDNPTLATKEHRAGNHMALDNLRERLMLFYDLEARLDCGEKDGRYCVCVDLPLRRNERSMPSATCRASPACSSLMTRPRPGRACAICLPISPASFRTGSSARRATDSRRSNCWCSTPRTSR